MNQALLTCVTAAAIGGLFCLRYPFPSGEALLQLLLLRSPVVYDGLRYSWYAMLFTTPAIVLHAVFSWVFIFVDTGKRKPGKLPPFPKALDSGPVHVVVGELHHPRRVEQVEQPSWLTLPLKGLCTGTVVIGATGAGKTAMAMRPFVKQILEHRAGDAERKIGGIVLEVKGSFCHEVRSVLREAGRMDDYLELSLESDWCYNPLHNNVDAFSLAHNIQSQITLLYGRGKDPFWPQASAYVMQNIIMLHRAVDQYVTLDQIWRSFALPGYLEDKIVAGDQLLAAADPAPVVVIDPMVYLQHGELATTTWEVKADRQGSNPQYYAPYSKALVEQLKGLGATYRMDSPEEVILDKAAERAMYLNAVKDWFYGEWMAMDPKLKTSIGSGITSYLSLFSIKGTALHRIFCPPKEYYDKAVPTMAEMLEAGKVVVLNFPMAENPATARVIACFMKLDYQRALLTRIPKMAAARDRYWRPVLFVADEYHAIATAGGSDPNGDDRFFSLSREALCIPIVATQSISSLKDVLPGETWRTLLQGFRTKIFMTTTDDFTAKIASELCGRLCDYVETHSINEAGQGVKVSKLTGKSVSDKTGLSMNWSWSKQWRPLFEPGEFTRLKNAQAIVCAYDGRSPMIPRLCYLKPYFAPVNKSYFAQAKAGEV
jgi:hypothetical protein